MGKKLAIKGHPTRGKEVIELLEMMGGINNEGYIGTNTWKDEYYFLDNGGIHAYDWCDGIKFTLEEFLEKYPFKVGDKVFDIADWDPGVITAMKWDEDVSDMKYHVAFDNGDMGWYTNDTIGFLKEDENLEEGKTMNKNLGIKGHPTRGKEIFELMEMMGGNINKKILSAAIIGDVLNPRVYFFDLDSSNNRIVWDYLLGLEHDGRASEMIIFTLEEFLEKYPFKVGDKVFLYDNITEGCVTGMEWDEDRGTVKYCVYTSDKYWCDVKELLKWNNIDLNERHYMDNMKEKDKAKAPDIKGEDYSGKRFGYKIPDGYEFDVVVDGKIFIKPIKSKYPASYEECCKVLDISCRAQLSYTYPEVEHNNIYLTKEKHLLDAFMKLRICRNAYWKIAGKEMGLGKSWEPDLEESDSGYVYCIVNKCNNIGLTCEWLRENHILSFPIEEMRDAFYKNFRDLIELCKELL